MDNINPDIVIYDAGVDVHKNDKLGNLNITSKGILERDKMVISFLKINLSQLQLLSVVDIQIII